MKKHFKIALVAILWLAFNNLFAQGDYDKTIADYSQSVRLHPNYQEAKQKLEEARRTKMAK